MELEFIQAKNRHWVPILNGTLLHSSVDPVREAKDIVDREWERINPVKSLLVFGLGGGFHVKELLSRKEFDIVVIESDRHLGQAMREREPELCSKLNLLSGFPPDQICAEPAVAEALSQSYAILKHPASVRVNPYYYASVIRVLNDRTLARLKQLSKGNESLAQFFDSLNISTDQILTLPMVEEAMARRGTGLEREGLIWMAMRELIV